MIKLWTLFAFTISSLASVNASSIKDLTATSSLIEQYKLKGKDQTVMVFESDFYLDHPQYKKQILTHSFVKNSKGNTSFFSYFLKKWQDETARIYKKENIIRWSMAMDKLKKKYNDFKENKINLVELQKIQSEFMKLPVSYFQKYIIEIIENFNENHFEDQLDTVEELGPSHYSMDKMPEQADLFWAFNAYEFYEVAQNILLLKNKEQASDKIKLLNQMYDSFYEEFNLLPHYDDYRQHISGLMSGLVIQASFGQNGLSKAYLSKWRHKLSMSVNMDWDLLQSLSRHFKKTSHSTFMLGVLSKLIPHANIFPVENPKHDYLDGIKMVRNALRITGYKVDVLSISNWTQGDQKIIGPILDVYETILKENTNLIIFKSAGNDYNQHGENSVFYHLVKKYPGRFILVGNHDVKNKKIEGMKAGSLNESYITTAGTEVRSYTPLEKLKVTGTGTSISAPVMAAFYLLTKEYLIKKFNYNSVGKNTWGLISQLSEFKKKKYMSKEVYGKGYFNLRYLEDLTEELLDKWIPDWSFTFM